jgi:hypothetical protein
MDTLFICTKRESPEVNPPHLIGYSGYCEFCGVSERELELAFDDSPMDE